MKTMEIETCGARILRSGKCAIYNDERCSMFFLMASSENMFKWEIIYLVLYLDRVSHFLFPLGFETLARNSLFVINLIFLTELETCHLK